MSIQRLQDGAAIAYFAQVLRAGGALDFDANALQGGRFGAVVPTSTSVERVVQFSTGGLLVPDRAPTDGPTKLEAVPTSISSVSAIVAQKIRQYDEPSFWVHEPMLQESEISASGYRSRRVGDELYLVYEENLASQDRIAEIVRYSMLSWHFLAFVTDGIHSVQSVPELATRAEMILVGAYDGESVLLWERSTTA